MESIPIDMDPNGDPQTPKSFGFQKFIVSSPSDAEKFAELNGTIIFEIDKNGEISRVGGLQNLDPLKCRNSGINAACRITIAKSATGRTSTRRCDHQPSYEFDALAWNSHILVCTGSLKMQDKTLQ